MATRITIFFLLLATVAGAQITTDTKDVQVARQKLQVGTDNTKWVSSIVEAITAAATHRQSPTAKAVYDYVSDIDSARLAYVDSLFATVGGQIDTFYRSNDTIYLKLVDDTQRFVVLPDSNLQDGDYGDIDVSGIGTVMTLDTATVTANKIADDAVEADKILAGAVTMDKISPSGASMGQVIKWNGSGWTPSYDGPQDTFYILLSGQSNAWGASGPSTTDTTSTPNVQIWNHASASPGWKTARINERPFRVDNYNSLDGGGTRDDLNGSNNHTFHFAKKITEETGALVRIVMAIGDGQKIITWHNGTSKQKYLDSMLIRSVASGVDKYDIFIWTQGESDDATEAQYILRFDSILATLRSQTYFPKTTPVVLVGMPLRAYGGRYDAQRKDTTLQKMAYRGDEWIAFAHTEDLAIANDSVHYDGASLRTIGRERIWTAFNSLPMRNVERNKTLTGIAGAGLANRMPVWITPTYLGYDESFYLDTVNNRLFNGTPFFDPQTSQGVNLGINKSGSRQIWFSADNTNGPLQGISNGTVRAFTGWINSTSGTGSFISGTQTAHDYIIRGGSAARITVHGSLSTDANGNALGIWSSPTNTGSFLSFSQNGTSPYLAITNGTQQGTFGITGTNELFFGTKTSDNLVFRTAATVRMRITSAGNIGVGTDITPSTSAIFHVGSTTKGSLLNPMTRNQRNAISSPVEGLLVFDNIQNAYSYHDSVRWVYTEKLIQPATATLDFPSTNPGECSELTVTVTGAADGDYAEVAAPAASWPNRGGFYAYVSATNTVTVRYCNNDLTTAKDPASGTFKVKVSKF